MFSIFRILKFTIQDIARNFSLSFMTVFILILMLLSINTLLVVDKLAQEAVLAVKDQINVSLYFVPTANQKDVENIKKYVQMFPEVINVTVKSKEEVLNSFEASYKVNQEVLSALDELGSNPFGPTMMIKTKEPQDYKKVIDALNVPEYSGLIEARSFDNHEEALTKLQNITNRVEKVGWGLAVLFAFISFLIIFNTIRVAIYTQRAEISIKRLVGASNWFIRGPYLLESVIFTLVSIAVTIVLVFVALHYLDPYLSVVFPNGLSLTNYYKLHILWLFGWQTLAVLLLTTVSSSLAMRRQLKV